MLSVSVNCCMLLPELSGVIIAYLRMMPFLYSGGGDSSEKVENMG